MPRSVDSTTTAAARSGSSGPRRSGGTTCPGPPGWCPASAAGLGGAREFSRSVASGGYGASSGAKTASRTKPTRTDARRYEQPVATEGPQPRIRPAPPRPRSSSIGTLIAHRAPGRHPRVDERVGMSTTVLTIDEGEHHEQHDRLDDRRSPACPRTAPAATPFRSGEGGLDDGARDQQAGHQETGDGQDRTERVAQHVPADHRPLWSSRGSAPPPRARGRSSSSIEDRVTRDTRAMKVRDSAIAGRNRW